jgi:hypothetical protein
MNILLGTPFMAIGVWMFAFAPRIARARVEVHYSPQELQMMRGRVRREQLLATTLNFVFGAFALYVAFLIFS